jgi:predicted kinase
VSGTELATLVVTLGLPGSGKSTMAAAWVDEDKAGRARVNRDLLRIMLHGGRLGTDAQEEMVTEVQNAGVFALLCRGVDVVVDDTNLRPGVVTTWRGLAARAGARVEIWDLTVVPLEECIRRDAQRTGPARVGEAVIRDMHARYLAGSVAAR